MDRPAAQASAVAGGRTHPVRVELAQLLKLSGPVVLARLGIMVMGLTDAVVVGHYSAAQLGYHAQAWAPTSVILTMTVGLLTGIQVMTARAVGQGRREAAGAVLRRGLSYALWIGLASALFLMLAGPAFLHVLGLPKDLADGATLPLLVFCLSLPCYAVSASASFWMEGLSRPGPAVWAMWAANLINLGLNLVLVPGAFGLPAMGAVGSAWSTFGARLTLAAFMLIYIARMPEARALGVFTKPERDRAAEAEQRRIGFGAGISNFFEVSAFASMTIIAGWVGGYATAAWAIVLNVAAIIFMVPLGLATGAAVRVGGAYGARDPAAVNRAGWIAFAVAAVFGVLVAVVVWPTAALISRAYTYDAAAVALAVPALIVACWMFAPDAAQVVTAQSLRARGDVWMPTVTHLASYIGVMMPLAWWLAIPRGMGVVGISWAVVVASFVSCLLLIGRWWMLAGRDA
ncbi:MATE family efflux transporter [Phenylobacterium deserti]|uniref:Multidrug-efflux transporter n=1 Tax=Phenylobacterium deserti TaxID=1914756 RepID=A0A328ACL2_9CAUL|nr:MATE family efflux transporter [Phenylobacterium deserti]RAK52379.1 MATE family efflux transporter [Phenylobacterium deserti]